MPLTADQFERMPDDDSVQIELDEGELITMPPAGEENSDLEAEILSRMRLFAKRHKLGKVYPGAAGFRLTDGTVRCPDVAFVLQKRLPSIRGSGFIARGLSHSLGGPPRTP